MIPQIIKKLTELKIEIIISEEDYLQQHPQTEQMCQTFQTKALLHPTQKPNPISQPNYLHMQINNHA